MSPTLLALLLGAAACVASAGGAGWLGYDYGTSKVIAQVKREDDVARVATEAASLSAAKAISAIKVSNTIVKGEIQRELRTNTVYVDCKHSDDQLRRLNAAITGQRPESPGGGVVPPANAPD